MLGSFVDARRELKMLVTVHFFIIDCSFLFLSFSVFFLLVLSLRDYPRPIQGESYQMEKLRLAHKPGRKEWWWGFSHRSRSWKKLNHLHNTYTCHIGFPLLCLCLILSTSQFR